MSTSFFMQRPLINEYKPAFSTYIDLVPDGNFTELLHHNTISTITFFKSIPAEKQDYAYAPGKWTTKQVLLHINDTERVMSYRALAALRGDSTSPLPGMDENAYVDNADLNNTTMDDLLTEFEAIRTATTKLFQHVTDQQSLRTAHVAGTPTTARALGYVIIGHVLHHVHVTKERYL